MMLEISPNFCPIFWVERWFSFDKMSAIFYGVAEYLYDPKSLALTPPSPLALAPLSQAWERGWG